MEAWSRCGRLIFDPNEGGFAVDEVASVRKHSQDLCHLASLLQNKTFFLSFTSRGPKLSTTFSIRLRDSIVRRRNYYESK
jgi:hypothetical protein